MLYCSNYICWIAGWIILVVCVCENSVVLLCIFPRAFIVIINVYCIEPLSYAATRVSIEIKAERERGKE